MFSCGSFGSFSGLGRLNDFEVSPGSGAGGSSEEGDVQSAWNGPNGSPRLRCVAVGKRAAFHFNLTILI